MHLPAGSFRRVQCIAGGLVITKSLLSVDLVSVASRTRQVMEDGPEGGPDDGPEDDADRKLTRPLAGMVRAVYYGMLKISFL